MYNTQIYEAINCKYFLELFEREGADAIYRCLLNLKTKATNIKDGIDYNDVVTSLHGVRAAYKTVSTSNIEYEIDELNDLLKETSQILSEYYKENLSADKSLLN